MACIEIGDLVRAGCRQPDGITAFDLTGIALPDLTVARLLHERACDTGMAASRARPW